MPTVQGVKPAAVSAALAAAQAAQTDADAALAAAGAAQTDADAALAAAGAAISKGDVNDFDQVTAVEMAALISGGTTVAGRVYLVVG